MKLHWTCDKHQGINDDRCDCGDDHLGKKPVNELKTLQEDSIKDIELARLFHDTYERLAPDFGYETREDTKQFDPFSNNGRLMIEVCRIVTDKSYTLGIMKGVELVEGVVTETSEKSVGNGTGIFVSMISKDEILSNIKSLKQELK